MSFLESEELSRELTNAEVSPSMNQGFDGWLALVLVKMVHNDALRFLYFLLFLSSSQHDVLCFSRGTSFATAAAAAAATAWTWTGF